MVVTELESIDGYTISDANRTRTIEVKPDDTQTIYIYNDPLCSLTITKLDSVTGKPVPDTEFTVKDANGNLIGRYTTGSDGTVTVTGLQPDSAVVVSESKVPKGYVLNPTPKTIVVTNGTGNTLTSGSTSSTSWSGSNSNGLIFENDPTTTLIIRKFINGTANEPLAGVAFKVVDGSGAAVGPDDGVYYTDNAGEIVLNDLEPGMTVTAREIKTVDGFVLDGTPQDIQIKAGEKQQLTFWNKRAGTLVIQKKDKLTNKPLAGVEFQVTDANGSYVPDENGHISSNGLYRSDSNGEIRINGVVGTLVVTETKTIDGYTIDENTRTQTVVVNPEDVQTLVFYNTPKTSLVIEKYVEGTTDPMKGVTFLVTNSSGEFVGKSNGEYVTDENGRIEITDLTPGETISVKELRTLEGYLLDSQPKSVKITEGEAHTLRFYNQKTGYLVIRKLDKVSKAPIAGAEFELTYANGEYVDDNFGHLSSKGRYTTNDAGEIRVPVVGTIVAKEVTAAPGYVIDSATQIQTVKVNPADTQTLVFYNEPLCSLTLTKRDSVTGKPVPGTEFTLKDGNGNIIGKYTTGQDGTVTVTGLIPGSTVVAVETKVPSGYVLDSTPKTIIVKNGTGNSIISGSTNTSVTPGSSGNNLDFENDPKVTLTIHKYIDGTANEPLAGVAFKVVDGSGTPLNPDGGVYYTNNAGEIVINDLEPGQTITAQEIKTVDGFVLDGKPQSIKIETGKAQSLTFWNKCAGTLVIRKLDKQTSKPLAGVEFELMYAEGGYVDTANGHLSSNGLYTTDDHGETHISGITGTIVVKETRPLPGYTIEPGRETQTVTVNSQETQTLTFYNIPSSTLVIEKYVEGTNEPLKGVTFLVTDSSGTFIGKTNGEYVTDENGRIEIPGITPGETITVKEIKTLEGYILDTQPKSIKITEGEAHTLKFYNQRKGTLVIRKLDKLTKEPLAGVEFELTYAEGGYVDNANGHLSSKGLYTTDSNGEIRVSGITGTIVVKETKTLPGYSIDPGSQSQTVTVNSADTQTITFYNTPGATLVIQKYVDGTTDPIQGVTFLVTDSAGTPLGNNQGEYVTDRNGRIAINNLTPGTTVIVKEVRAADGYVLDGQPQTVLIKEGDAQQVTFYNKTNGGVEIIKVDAADKTKRLANVTFEIRRMDGGLVDTVTTGADGRVQIDLGAGDYYALEIEAAEGYKLDGTPHYFTVVDGKPTSVTITNSAFSGIIIHKVNSVTGEGIYDVKFLVYDQNKNPIGEYSTDNEGYIYIDDLTVQGKGKLFIRELEAAPGYEPDKEYKTVYVQPGKTIEIEWKNVPITGQFQVYKYAAEYNEVTGTPAGAPLKGAVYEISEVRSGKVVDYITTDARGVAASKPLPLGRYKIVEVTPPAYWKLSGTTFDETLEYSGQIIKVSDYDKPSNLGVTITKRGNAEVLAGSQMRYDFTVANTSNVPLDNFFWHDRIPTDAATAMMLTTGTYSARLNYRILYKTSSGGDYQVLASNLTSISSYAFNLNAIPTMAGEKVTEIYFDFGKVPVGFQSVTSPTLSVVISGNVANGYQLMNRADAGGKYQGAWQTAQGYWVTIVRKLDTPKPNLPKTGY